MAKKKVKHLGLESAQSRMDELMEQYQEVMEKKLREYDNLVEKAKQQMKSMTENAAPPEKDKPKQEPESVWHTIEGKRVLVLNEAAAEIFNTIFEHTTILCRELSKIEYKKRK